MSGPGSPDAPPPEVPEEFAAAYRDAFNRALEEGRHRAGAHEAGVEAVAEEIEEAEEDQQDQTAGEQDQQDEPDGPKHREPMDPLVPAAAGRVTEYRAATPFERLRESRVFVPLVVVLLALLLIAGAYGAGKLFSNEVDDAGGAAEQTARQQAAKDGKNDKARQPKDKKKTESNKKTEPPQPWQGKVIPARIGDVAAQCTMSPGVDAGGARTTYEVAHVKDGEPSTAWRCDGDAIGERLVITLPGKPKVGLVGLVPGYAKTDPVDGSDRYAENNRITRVRWTLGSGVEVIQELDGSADDRSMQTLRVPPTTTGRIVLEILEVTDGPRDTTAISEVSVGAVAG